MMGDTRDMVLAYTGFDYSITIFTGVSEFRSYNNYYL